MKIKLNETTQIDLSTLIDTRLLVQANSGGGKSWLLRRILEQSHGKVQQIILDLEGEFSTLREKYDYILVAKEGDIPVDVKSAKLLAKKLLELNVSAIIDLYELDHFNRKQFVKLFLDSIVNAPKNLWHPCIVVVDEAHFFCPEKGQSEASSAVIDLMTRGRKRGYCGVLATQRLSKLHKDAAAECNNKLIGRTGLDVDMKRAAEELGFTSKEQYISLRTLDPGEFFGFGPAISNEVIRLKVGDVETTHPKAGSRILTQTVPPTEKIKSLLNQLQDLPQEAKKEEETIDSLKREIIELKKTRNGLTVEIPKEIMQQELVKAVKKVSDNYDKELQKWIDHARQLREILGAILETVEKAKELPEPELTVIEPLTPMGKEIKLPDSVVTGNKPYQHSFSTSAEENKPITGGALRMLQVLSVRYPMKFTKAQLATLSKLKSTSGTYGTYMSLLRTNGLIELNGDQISITEKGFSLVGAVPENQEDTVSMWRSSLNGGAQRMFDYLIEIYPRRVSKDDLGDSTGLNSRSGTFGTYLSMLRSNGLVKVEDGYIQASENLFI